MSKAGGNAFSDFVVHSNKLLILGYPEFICAKLNGEVVWRTDVILPEYSARPAPRDRTDEKLLPVTPLPTYRIIGWRDKVVLAGLHGAVKVLSLDDGRLIWSLPAKETEADTEPQPGPQLPERRRRVDLPHPVIHNDILFFAGDRVIRRFSLKTGKELDPFEFATEGKDRGVFLSHLAASDSTLFFCAGPESSEKSHLHALNLESGQTIWKHPWGSSLVQIAVADGKVYAAGQPDSRVVRSHVPLLVFEHSMGVSLPTKLLLQGITSEMQLIFGPMLV